jgi:hypothetical protein
MVFACFGSTFHPTYAEQSHEFMKYWPVGFDTGKFRAKNPVKNSNSNSQHEPWKYYSTLGNVSPFRDGPESLPTIASVALKAPQNCDNLIAGKRLEDAEVDLSFR